MRNPWIGSMRFLLWIGFLSSIVPLKTLAQHRYLIFANGYFGPIYDKKPPSTGVTLHEPKYWYSFDDTIIQRFQPSKTFYISGHHSIKTSSHRSLLNAAKSYLITRFIWFKSRRGIGLNHRPNPSGFELRKQNGEECGKNFLRFIQDSIKSNPKFDTLDIVCHSYGYAYTLGFLESVDQVFTLGKILIISPESPQLGAYKNWNAFEEVWQYGSNLGEKESNIIALQDGIAPQAAIKNIETLSKGKGGRIFIPQHTLKGFIVSHHMLFFRWYRKIKPGEFGYFTLHHSKN